MVSVEGLKSTSANVLFYSRAAAYEESIRKNLETFKELILEVKKIQDKLDDCEAELFNHQDKCKRKKCHSSEDYEKVLASKNNIIQLAVATALRIDETKNLSMISELLKILSSDAPTLTPPKESHDDKENISKPATPLKKKLSTDVKSSPVRKKKITSPKKELDTSMEDVSIRDESVSEIEGTPGRTSPIIPTKKLKSSCSISSLSGTSTDSRDKKKCPDDWNKSETKQIKLCYPSPKRFGNKTRQSRLMFVTTKPTSVVDLTNLTSPPEVGSSNRPTGEDQASSLNQVENNLDPSSTNQNPHIQIIIKKESSDNDDTILPSPTSGPTNIILPRTPLKDSQKFKKPLSLIKVKAEAVEEACSPIIHFVADKKYKTMKNEELLEDSINILQPNRFAKSPHKTKKAGIEQSVTQVGQPQCDQVKSELGVANDDVTRCDSMSILQCVDKIEQNSSTKKPLAEIQNMPPERERDVEDNSKQKVLEVVEPVYKEPTVRKKAEKMALPAWCCDECKVFFGNLYSNEPEKIKAIIERCSKHRGRNNPARPRTPPGFWYPRWSVPTDTEEFNRRNNAD